jgi:hypothetical protein
MYILHVDVKEKNSQMNKYTLRLMTHEKKKGSKKIKSLFETWSRKTKHKNTAFM